MNKQSLNVIFMGTPDFSVPVLRTLVEEGYNVVQVVTQPDKPVGRKQVLTPPPVKVEAERHNIPVYQPTKIREREQYEPLLALNAQLIVTAAYGQILPNELLEAPQYGAINVHASLLPKLRGGAPIHYSILEGHEKTGVTIMYMVEQLDAGDMLSKVEVVIEERDHVGSLHDKLSIAGAQLLKETIPALIAGEITADVQPHEQATFARNIKREQERIDWTKDGATIYNHIRGLHPWPVAYTSVNGQTLKVWWGEKVEGTGTPGTIIRVEKDGFVVATSSDVAIKLTDIQPAGKKRMATQQLLNGNHPYQVGTVLGE